jgi:hypothetical protein
MKKASSIPTQGTPYGQETGVSVKAGADEAENDHCRDV